MSGPARQVSRPVAASRQPTPNFRNGVIRFTGPAPTRRESAAEGNEPMSPHHSIARKSPALRRFRPYAPLLVVWALMLLMLAAVALHSGVSSRIDLCGDARAAPDTCAERCRAALAERDLAR